jgi:hypothetical protein
MARLNHLICNKRRRVNRCETVRPTRLFERLEERSLFSTHPLTLPLNPEEATHVLWAPDTPASVVESWENQFAALGADINTIDGDRWTNTATDGGNLGQGHPSTITWGVVPDGTPISGFNGEPSAPSDLRATLDRIYGSMNTWLPLFEQTFDRWEAVSGIDFVYEPNDDRVALSSSNRGILGRRADMRIGGHRIDGNSNVLAYNFFPNVGDMVIDTADSFYNGVSNNSLGLRNVLAHEAGHGLGLEHSLPTAGTKLMEPFLNMSFDGPQHDDILRINRGYGDRLEGNDTTTTAYALGPLTIQPITVSNVSIDDDSDVDYYGFSVDAGLLVDFTLEPFGSVYTVGLEGGSNASFDSRAQSNLAFTVLAANGTTVVASANAAGIGASELLVDLSLAAGQYFLRVTGAQNAAQLYSLTVDADPAAAGTIEGSLWNDSDGDGIRDGGEASLAGWTVFLDINTNGALDSGEASAITAATGSYAFGALAAGTYTVRQVIPAGWEQTFPAPAGTPAQPRSVALSQGQRATGIDFGNRRPSTSSPVLAPIGNQTIQSSQDALQLNLTATDANNDPLTYTVIAQSAEYHLDQTLGLSAVGGNEYLNWGGRNEKWLTGAASIWYYLTPDGKLYRWLGGSTAGDPVVEQVSTAAYANTALLHTAQPNSAQASVSVNGSTLTINPHDGFSGKLYVTATVSDGVLTDSESFVLTVQAAATDTAPPAITTQTPANGATITTSSTNIDVTFSEAVTGVDATDLVLSGSGAASAVQGAPTNIGGNTWRFTVTNLQSGPVNIALATDANDIEDMAGNDLAPSNWTFTVSLPVIPPPPPTPSPPAPPVLSPIVDQTMPSSQDSLLINLTASDANNDPLTYSATAQSVEYHLDQTLGLSAVGGNEYLNWGGRNEKWLTSASGAWYYVTPDGKLYRWLGGGLASDPLVEQVSAAAYANTALLHSAPANNAPASLSVNGSTLTINPNDGFRGKIYVTATVNDGQGGTDSKQFTLLVA